MDYQIVKAIIASEFREHPYELFAASNFSYGNGEGEISILQASEYAANLVKEKVCEKCEVTLKMGTKNYLFIEFKLKKIE